MSTYVFTELCFGWFFNEVTNDRVPKSTFIAVINRVEMIRQCFAADVVFNTQIAERTWRMTGRAKFLEGHDIHVLCESPSAWHLLDGYGLRLPCPAAADQSLRAQFNVRMLTVLDLSLTVVQLIQVIRSLLKLSVKQCCWTMIYADVLRSVVVIIIIIIIIITSSYCAVERFSVDYCV